MTLKQAKWAEQHDWYIGRVLTGMSDGDYAVICEDRAFHPDGKETVATVRFTQLSKLRDWAGY